MGLPWAPEGNLCGAALSRRVHGSKCRQPFRSNLSWVHRYELASILKGHRGCVNTIQWSPDATLLCSGSDDQHVNLWRFDSSNAGGTVSPLCSLATMHRHNVFDAQLTRCQHKIVSCGADGWVCATQVEASGHAAGRRLLYEPGAGHYLASKLAFLRHTGPDCFLVTFGDGHVRLFDLREQEHRVALDADGVGLTGIELHPTNDALLAIGGNDAFLRLYDLRTLSFSREEPLLEVGGAPPTPVVSLHTTPQLLSESGRHQRSAMWSSRFWSGSSDIGISGVSWSPDGRRLLANYRGGDVVLFDMSEQAPDDAAEGASPRAAELPEELQLPAERVELNVVRSFVGRTNEQTCAKEVRFLCGDAAVATGGDCGGFFIWEAATGKLLRKMPADRCVVNCVAPHPVLPMVCTSGIDSEIKAWDVGNSRVRGAETRKRSSSGDLGSSSDWGRRRREAAPNAAVAEARERLRAAERKKQRGNALVKQASWDEALEQYREALQELHFVAPNTETEREREALANGCCLNCAFCHLGLEDYAAVVVDCTRVLESDRGSVKALFRRATALGELQDFGRALEDAEAALALDSESTEVARLHAKLLKQQRQHQKRQRGLYKRLFSRATSSQE